MLDFPKGLTAGQPFFLCLVEIVGSFIYIMQRLKPNLTKGNYGKSENTG